MRCWCADRVQAGDDHHFPRVGRASQGARFDDREIFAEAIRLAVPDAFDLARPRPPRWHLRICVMPRKPGHNRWSRALVWGEIAPGASLARALGLEENRISSAPARA